MDKPMTEERHRLIVHLEKLSGNDADRNPGALAALRQGLGVPPGTCAEMFPHVLPYLNDSEVQYNFEEHCLLAALFAWHPQSSSSGNMGDHMCQAGKDSEEATERRFVALLRSHPDDLHIHLRQAVGFLKTKDVGVNWDQLRKHLIHWEHESYYVQKAWSRSFWGRRADQSPETNQ